MLPDSEWTRPRWAELIQLLVITSLGCLVLFLPALQPGHVLASPSWTDESAHHFLPWAQFVRDCHRDGAFPAWDPHSGLGRPFLANPQAALYFPLAWLFTALPLTVASFVAAYLKILIAALGMYLLARRLGMGHPAAMLGGIAYGFLPHFFAHAAYPTSSSEMWIPWTLAVTVAYAESGRFRWILMLAALLVVQLTGGQVAVWGATILFVTAFFFWCGRPPAVITGRLGYALRFLAFVPITLALSAGIWPAVLESVLSHGAVTIPVGIPPVSSPGAHLLQLLVPSSFGYPSPDSGSGAAGYRSTVLYAGAVILLLAFTRFLHRRGWREKSFCLGFVILFGVLCVWPSTGIVNPSLAASPRPAASVADLYAFLGLCLILPALRELDDWRWEKRRLLLLAAGAVLIGIAVVGTGVFLGSMKRHDLVEHALRNLVILVLLFGTAAVVLRAWNGRPRLALCALLGLLFVDLYVVDRTFVESVSLDRLYPGRRDVEALVHSVPMGRTSRFYCPDMPPDVHLMYRVNSIGVPSRWMTGDEVCADPFSVILSRPDLRTMAGLFGVRYLLARSHPGPDGLTWLRTRGQWSLYEIEDSLPRATFHTRVRWAASDREAREQVAADPARCRAEPILAGRSGTPDAGGTAERDRRTAPLLIRIGHADATTVEVHVQSPQAGWLVLRDLHYPGWRADVDGRKVEILKANGVCRAVALPAGSHRVRFSYQPLPFRISFLVAILSWVGLLIAGIWSWARWSTSAAKPKNSIGESSPLIQRIEATTPNRSG